MIEELVNQIETRFGELGAQMSDPEVIGDRERYAEVGRAYSQLTKYFFISLYFANYNLLIRFLFISS